MESKKLISPEFRISTEQYEISGGIEVECFSSREARADWCKVSFATVMQGKVSYEDMDPAIVELGYDDDYDILLSGFCRRSAGDMWKEMLIRDAMIKLDRISVKASFTGCTPQDIIKYVLAQAGITKYFLSDAIYGTKEVLVVDRISGRGVAAVKDRAAGREQQVALERVVRVAVGVDHQGHAALYAFVLTEMHGGPCLLVEEVRHLLLQGLEDVRTCRIAHLLVVDGQLHLQFLCF